MREVINQYPNSYREYEAEEIIPIESQAVPKPAADFFEWASGRLTNQPAIKLDEFDLLLKLDRDDGVTTFIAIHDKNYDDFGFFGRAVYLADVLPTGEKIGLGEFYCELNNDDALPTVWTTSNATDFYRRGYGTQRFLAMNATARLLFNKPLQSDTDPTEGAIGAWEHLVVAGIAERLEKPIGSPEWEPYNLYRFKSV